MMITYTEEVVRYISVEVDDDLIVDGELDTPEIRELIFERAAMRGWDGEDVLGTELEEF